MTQSAAEAMFHNTNNALFNATLGWQNDELPGQKVVQTTMPILAVLNIVTSNEITAPLQCSCTISSAAKSECRLSLVHASIFSPSRLESSKASVVWLNVDILHRSLGYLIWTTLCNFNKEVRQQFFNSEAFIVRNGSRNARWDIYE